MGSHMHFFLLEACSCMALRLAGKAGSVRPPPRASRMHLARLKNLGCQKKNIAIDHSRQNLALLFLVSFKMTFFIMNSHGHLQLFQPVITCFRISLTNRRVSSQRGPHQSGRHDNVSFTVPVQCRQQLLRESIVQCRLRAPLAPHSEANLSAS